MRTRMIVALVLAVVGLSIMGCPSGPIPGWGTTLYISNYSGDTVVAVYVSPSSSAYWGDNQLSYTIPPGYDSSLTGISAGYYDLMAVGRSGGTWVEYDVYISGDSFTWNLYNKKGSEASSFGPVEGLPELSSLEPIPYVQSESGQIK